LVTLAALAGGALGLFASAAFDPEPVIRVLPYPHHIPKSPGGVSLRFAMVQDVIHERFARHGPEYYRERNRRVRELLNRLPAEDRYALLDDLGAGLNHLGEHDDAALVLRDKLAEQERFGITGRELYTTYANLGTFLIHGNSHRAMAGDAAATERLREGLSFICQAIEVNPDSHFGREQWQVAAVEFLLAAIDRPALLREFDLIGNRLSESIVPRVRREYDQMWTYWARASADAIREDNLSESSLLSMREHMTKVGANPGWPTDRMPSHTKPVPFDEPVLGMIGIWRQGGGANPHFALSLGETMLRVGQRYLAWTAYERAYLLADRYWPDAELQQFLRGHCRERQKVIENELPPADVAELRPRFEAELAYGQTYQRDYQQYETDQIARGASIDDPHFYDAFHAARPPIASPVGPEDELRVYSEMSLTVRWVFRRLSLGLLGAGIGAFATAWLLARTRRRRPVPGDKPSTSR
jgi:hypothetical protein